ncbi:MAG: TolC family protein [Bacteroidales bacterium]
MKIKVASLWMMITGISLFAQDSITLTDCHRLATENAPRMEDSEVIRTIESLKISKIARNWLPELNVNGKITYQSDVVTVALENAPIPVEFPEVPQDQYALNLDLSQTLYDGGINSRKKNLEKTDADVELQQVKVDLYGIREQVNQLFFTTLVLQENLLNLGISLENLVSRREVLQTSFENGVVQESDLMAVDVEILRLRQAMVEIETNKKSCLETLEVLCGIEFREETILLKPDPDSLEEKEGERPEYHLFELKEASIDAGRELLKRKRIPVLYAFGQTGYGKPGYNMLNDQWDFYYMVGAGLRWNIWDWNQSGQEAMVMEQQKRLLKNRRAAFDRQIASRSVREKARIAQYRRILELDEQVLELQQEIAERAATKLEFGTVTATDYLIELNREIQARIKLTTDQIRLLQSFVNELTLRGKL